MSLFRRLPSFVLIGAVWTGAQATAQTFDGPAHVYRTAYTWHDNTPPGSAVIARSVVHDRAGGVGTWEDPITVAVGHSATDGVHTWDVPAGTRLYFPDLARYGVVEDLCGDGDRPQDGPCHTGFEGHLWVDIWIDGRSLSASDADACAARVTGVVEVVWNPASNLPVQAGVIAESGCR